MGKLYFALYGLAILILFLINIDFTEIKGIGFINLKMLAFLLSFVILTITIRGYRWKALIKLLTKKDIFMNLAMTSILAY